MIKDAQGRKWFMRFRQYQQGWQWNARCGSVNLIQSSAETLYATKAAAVAAAERAITSSDAVATAKEFWRRVVGRGSECQLTADDVEAIRRAAAGRRR
jgi:hypothetical protein